MFYGIQRGGYISWTHQRQSQKLNVAEVYVVIILKWIWRWEKSDVQNALTGTSREIWASFKNKCGFDFEFLSHHQKLKAGLYFDDDKILPDFLQKNSNRT